MNDQLVQHVQERLKALANAEKAVEMAAYMKTKMSFYGVQKPDRLPIIQELKRDFQPASLAEYKANILSLWQLPFREEKYLAINYAELFPQFITIDSLSLYEQMVREGAWWDYTDSIASHLSGPVLLANESEVRPIIDRYIYDEDFWIRRTGLLSHLGHKKNTSHKHLFSYCRKLAPEKEFFIRKAIGWALREYSKSEPEKVKQFLAENKGKLSALSFNEGAKHLIKVGSMKG
ncbi:DNA alkylation repair protein [soil metagenome]